MIITNQKTNRFQKSSLNPQGGEQKRIELSRNMMEN